MADLPTDREILQEIYNRCLPLYPGPPMPDGKHQNDPFLPIDLIALGDSLGCSPQMLFGRLYYHITPKHRHSGDIKNEMPLFTPRAGAHRHAVNFPYLTSVLATYEDEHQKYRRTNKVSVLSLAVAATALIVSVLVYFL